MNVDSKIYVGQADAAMRYLVDGTVRCVVTSPPYWGIRDYGTQGQYGLERNLDEFIDRLVRTFDLARNKMTDDGVLWLSMGDCYTSGGRPDRAPDSKNKHRGLVSVRPPTPEGMKKKDLVGVPWTLAMALRDDGWYLRSDVVWQKPNVQPESVRDRPVGDHEYLFMLTKSMNCAYDRTRVATGTRSNMRSTWSINVARSGRGHPAPFPDELVRRCLQSCTVEGDLVLDPFMGSGTTARVALAMNRKVVGVELNPEYARAAADDTGLPLIRIRGRMVMRPALDTKELNPLL